MFICCMPVGLLRHSIAIAMEFKAYTELQIVVKIAYGQRHMCIKKGMRFSSLDLVTAQKKRRKKIVHES